MRFAPKPRVREAALTGEGILLLVIGVAVVTFCVWLASQGSVATEDEARVYADRTFQRLLIAHDAAYFAANLTPRARGAYPPDAQNYLFATLTKMGAPSAPLKINGSIAYDSLLGAQDPIGRFESKVDYPKTKADFLLAVARHQGLWRIDFFAATWKEKSAPAPR